MADQSEPSESRRGVTLDDLLLLSIWLLILANGVFHLGMGWGVW